MANININSLRNKLEALNNSVTEYIDIITVVVNGASWDTHLSHKVNQFSHFHIPFFYIFLTPKITDKILKSTTIIFLQYLNNYLKPMYMFRHA